MAIENLTLQYTKADLSGAAADVMLLPIIKPGTITALDILTDANVAGDVVFALYKNGVLQSSAAATVATGNKIVSVTGLSIAVVKGDEIVLRRSSGAISSPVTLNLVVDDGISSSLPTGGTTGQVLTKQSGTDGDADWKTLQIGYKKVNWTNLVNCTDNGDSDASERGMLTKGSGTGTAWNAGAGSVESFSTGKLRVVFDNVNFAAFWGLATTNVVADEPNWTALPISIFNNNGTCRYSQNGTFLEEFSIAAYDVIEIEVIRMNGNNHLVRLWKNNDPLGNVHSLSGRSEPQYYAMCSLVTPNQIFGAPDMLKNT